MITSKLMIGIVTSTIALSFAPGCVGGEAEDLVSMDDDTVLNSEDAVCAVSLTAQTEPSALITARMSFDNSCQSNSCNIRWVELWSYAACGREIPSLLSLGNAVAQKYRIPVDETRGENISQNKIATRFPFTEPGGANMLQAIKNAGGNGTFSVRLLKNEHGNDSAEYLYVFNFASARKVIALRTELAWE
jgi:hypothetical protein